jgi:queuine tRNA-ribosyltransferase
VTAPSFSLLATDGGARRGRLTTRHGLVETPAFMPVGTRAAVKSLSPDDVRSAGAQIILSNTFHLLVRPGPDLIRELGGLHRFMGWDGPILTDSGGFQVFSLARLRTLSEEAVEFRAPADGSLHRLSPERAIEVQHALGADVIHPLDECLGYPATRADTERSLGLTVRWARRSLAAHRAGGSEAALFGIVQGGFEADLRARAVAETVALGFDGYAIGGMAVGEPKPMMRDLAALVAAALPVERPRYLMGVGKPQDIVGAVRRGIDMFDCVLPTRSGRTGQAFTRRGAVNIRNARHIEDPRPLDEACACPACRGYSRAYLHHLWRAEEILGQMLLTWHNLHYYQQLMASLRAAVAGGCLSAWTTAFEAEQAAGDIESL